MITVVTTIYDYFHFQLSSNPAGFDQSESYPQLHMAGNVQIRVDDSSTNVDCFSQRFCGSEWFCFFPFKTLDWFHGCTSFYYQSLEVIHHWIIRHSIKLWLLFYNYCFGCWPTLSSAFKVGGFVVDLGSGSGNDFLTLKVGPAESQGYFNSWMVYFMKIRWKILQTWFIQNVLKLFLNENLEIWGVLPPLKRNHQAIWHAFPGSGRARFAAAGGEPNRFTWETAASEARDLGSDVSFAADLQEAGLGSAVGFLPMLDTKKMVDFSGKTGVWAEWHILQQYGDQSSKENHRISVFTHTRVNLTREHVGICSLSTNQSMTMTQILDISLEPQMALFPKVRMSSFDHISI